MFNANKGKRKISSMPDMNFTHEFLLSDSAQKKKAKLANVSPAAPPTPRSMPGYYPCASSNVIQFTQLTNLPFWEGWG